MAENKFMSDLVIDGALTQKSVFNSVVKVDTTGKFIAAVPGTDFLTANLYNSNGTLTSNRIIAGSAKSLEFQDLAWFQTGLNSNNYFRVDSFGLYYNKQNTFGANYMSYDNNGLYIYNTGSTASGQLDFSGNNFSVYTGNNNLSLSNSSINFFVAGGGTFQLASNGFNLADYSTNGSLTLYTQNLLSIKAGTSAGSASIKTDLLTAVRNYQFPNESGTLALLSNLPVTPNLTWTAGTGNLSIAGGNTVNLDGRYLSDADGVKWGSGGSSMYNGYPGNSLTYHSIGTPDGGVGFAYNAAQANTGIYSSQLYVGCSAGPGQAVDSFWYRANQQGGPGWPTPWYQVASRTWVTTQGYLTSFTETDPVYNAAVPNIFMYKASLTSGQDLNTVIVTGMYSASNTISGTLLNTPQSGSPFILEVLKNTAAGLYTLQRATYNGNVSYRRFSGDGGTTWSTWSKFVGSTDVILNTTSLQASSNFYISGSGRMTNLGIGAAPSTSSSVIVSKSIVGAASSFGVRQDGEVQSTVSNGYGFYNLTAVAPGFALGDYNHYVASQGTIGAGSTISRQLGFRVASNMIGANTTYGFYGEIPAGTNRWNVYMSGTAQNYFAGNVGIGVTTPSTALHLSSGSVLRLAGVTSSILKTNSSGDIVAAVSGTDYLATGSVILNQYASGQTANFWINGYARANCFLADGYGYAMAAQSGYYGFFTNSDFTTALSIKANSLVLSSSYSTNAPTNGLYVQGDTQLNSLAGSGTRMVTVDATGNLSAATIPGSTSYGTPTVTCLSAGCTATLVSGKDNGGIINVSNNTGSIISSIMVRVTFGNPFPTGAVAYVHGDASETHLTYASNLGSATAFDFKIVNGLFGGADADYIYQVEGW